jgi:high-affinity nickel permease
MTNLLTVMGVGFLLGMRHATDPDHIVAVTTFVCRQQSARSARLIGMLWGVGHSITISFVGAAIIVFNLAIPARVGLALELAVGLMLIFLGALNLSGVLQWITERMTPVIHPHAHSPGVEPHAHVHGHALEAHLHLEQEPAGRLRQALERIGLYQILRPLAVGIVHGLAGSAAIALLIMATIRDPAWALFYLLVFGLGTIAGMMLITTLIGAPFAYTGTRKKFKRFNQALAMASGLVSVAFGMFVTFQVGYAGALFTADPHWTPH